MLAVAIPAKLNIAYRLSCKFGGETIKVCHAVPSFSCGNFLGQGGFSKFGDCSIFLNVFLHDLGGGTSRQTLEHEFGEGHSAEGESLSRNTGCWSIYQSLYNG